MPYFYEPMARLLASIHPALVGIVPLFFFMLIMFMWYYYDEDVIRERERQRARKKQAKR